MDEDRLGELLLEWAERRRQGQPASPEELCAGAPELVEPLRERARRLEAMEEFLGVHGPAGAGTAAPQTWVHPAGASLTPASPPTHPVAGTPLAMPGGTGRLGPYRVQQVLGEGGMGLVLRAEDPVLRRPVALKVMRPELAARPEFRRRFLREARAAAAVQHPHVVTIHHVGEEGDTPYLVMPLLEGESLAARLRRGGPLPLPEVVRVGREAAEGLAAAHARGLVHRDVKPGNIWLEGEAGTVRLLDFGLARGGRGEATLTAPGAVVGTVAYMAPEQARGEAVDARSDLFSLGVVLYEMCTGRRPFRGTDTLAQLTALATEDPPPVASLNPDVPAPLSALIQGLMAKDRAARPGSAREVAERLRALEGVVAGGRPTSPTPSSWPRSPFAWARALGGRRRWLAVGLTGFLVLVAVLWVVWRGRGLSGPNPKAADPPGPAARLIRTFKGHRGVVWGVTFSPSGKYALSCSGMAPADPRPADPDCGLRLWEVESGRQVGFFRVPDEAVLCVTFSPDGRRAISGGWNGSLRVWDVDGRREIACFKKLHQDQVHGVAYSPDGLRALSGSYDEDGIILLWEVKSGAILKRFKGHHSAVTHVVLSTDGLRALSGGADSTVRFWDVAKEQELVWIRADTRYVTCVALSPDGRHALSAGAAGDDLQLWDLGTGEEVRRFRGHEACVWRAIFSPAGDRMLSCSQDKTVRLWDVGTGKELACMRGHTDQVYCVAFSPDGRRALSASADGSVRLWQLPGSPPR